MATFTDFIKVVFQIDSGQAKQGLADVEGGAAKAEGTFGKLKQGAGNLGASIKSGLGDPMTQLALGGATAVVAFGAKAIAAFQDTALAAGKLADATGVTTQEAGRLIEVFDDVGVSSESVQTGLNKMNKAVDGNREEFDKLGLIGKTTGETFINVVQYLNAIQDPAKRAAEGTRLLGKGWTDMAEIVAAGGESLTKSMEEVSTHKAVTPEQVAQARKFRDTMDALSDTMDEVTLTIGESLLPTVQELASDIDHVVGPINDVTGSVGGLGNAIKLVVTNIGPLGAIIHMMDAADAVGGFLGGLFDSGPSDAEKLAEKNKKLADSYKEMEHGVRGAAIANSEYVSEADLAKDAADEQAKAAKANAKEQKDLEDALKGAMKATDEMTDSVFASVDANYASSKAHKEAERAIRSGKGATEEGMDAIMKSAVADEEAAKQKAILAGKTWDANDKNESYIKSLQGLQANTKVGSPTWLAIQALIDQLNAIPKAVPIIITLDAFWANKQLQDLQQKIDTIERRSAAGSAGGRGTAIPTAASAGVTNISIRTGLAGSDRAVAREVRRQLNLDRFSA